MQEIKTQIKDYWNKQACGTNVTEKQKYTKEYFEEIEAERYRREPEIREFAEFDKYPGKKLLEVGIGAGTDFLQWVRGGTEAYGIDITEEAVEHMERRLEIYGMSAKEIRVADCEDLPYDNNSFDVVYSWGVIHHTPDMPKALREIVRVAKPGGQCKIMVYHRYSLLVYFFWIKHALLKLKPWKSLSWILYNHMESTGTKAYTVNEIKELLNKEAIENAEIKPVLSYYDRLERFPGVFRIFAKIAAFLLGGDKAGWFLTFQFTKK